MKNIEIEIELENETNKVFYLHQDISGMSLYQRTKAIDRFVHYETKILEQCIENEIKDIFRRNGISVLGTQDSALKLAFTQLNGKNKSIAIVDRYKDINFENIVGVSDNHMTVILEDDYMLSCAMEVKEITI